MSFAAVKHQETAVGLLKRIVAGGRAANTYLFIGPSGVGKRAAAAAFAAALLCPDAKGGDSCGICPSCRSAARGEHADISVWERPEDKKVFSIEMVRRISEHLSLKSYYGGRKVAILDEADSMNQEAANAALLTLEEPPPGSVLILTAANADALPATVLSRCQKVYFRPLPTEGVRRILEETLKVPASEAARAAALAEGSVAAAADLLLPAAQASWREATILLDRVRQAAESGEYYIPATKSGAREETDRLVAAIRRILRLGLRRRIGLLVGGIDDPQSQTLVEDLARSLSERDFQASLEVVTVAEAGLRGNANARLAAEGLAIDLGDIFLGRRHETVAAAGP